MKRFVSTLPGNIILCFKGRLIFWHLLAILITLILVRSGCDWQYFLATRNLAGMAWIFSAVPIGGLFPIVLPLALITGGIITRNGRTTCTGWRIGQAELIGSLISSAYKAATGRAHPAGSVGPDISQVFHFGFLRGGVFWGWPSSHTTIAFAMAGTILKLFPGQKWLAVAAFGYALFIGLGVSVTIHWLSDFVAGAIVGTMIGIVTGDSFRPSGVKPDHVPVNDHS